MNLEIERPIAQRVLDRGRGRIVTVTLGPPRSFGAAQTDYYCPYRIDGIDDEPLVAFAVGIDGIQAIIMALAKIGDYLDSRRNDLELSFLGMNQLGFLSAELLRPITGDDAQ